MDRASILGDAIEYLKEFLQRINDLHNELEARARFFAITYNKLSSIDTHPTYPFISCQGGIMLKLIAKPQKPTCKDIYKDMRTISPSSPLRGLAVGFGISCGLIGGSGENKQGHLFMSNMSSHGVNLSRLIRMKKGPTS